MKIVKRIVTVVMSCTLVFSTTGCAFIDTAKEKGLEAVEIVKDTAIEIKDGVVDWYNGIDFSQFQTGWECATNYISAEYATITSTDYIKEVADQIDILKTDINSSMNSARGIAQEAGFVAEKWVADSFNIDAALNQSKYRADVVGSNEFASPDITTNFKEEASLKYYKTASESAAAQAQNIVERYCEYFNNAKANGTEKIKTLEEYVNERGYDYNSMHDLMASVYENSTRIIPEDQLKAAAQYLKNKISQEELLASLDNSGIHEEIKASLTETLSALKDRLTAPDGTTSKPLTKQDAELIAGLAKNGEFDPEDFGLSVSQLVTPKYILKQSMQSGGIAAAISAAATIGPDLYAIIIDAVQTGQVKPEELENIGLDAVIGGSEGFVEGAISGLVIQLCRSGALGSSLAEASSANSVAAIVVLAIQAIRYGYYLSEELITPLEYGDLMAENIIVTAAALASAGVLTICFPEALPIVYIAGSLAGGLIASAGYQFGKETLSFTLEDAGYFGAFVNTKTVDTLEVAKEAISNLNIQEKTTELKDFVVSTTTEGYVTISSMYAGG